MDSIYILLLTFLLYIFLGAIVDVFIATESSTQLFRVKAKVFFHTFAAPIIFTLVILFVIMTDNKAFNIFFGVGFIIGSLGRAFFGERKYLTNLQVDNSQLNIEYLTSLLNTKRHSFNLADLSDIEIKKAKWLIDYPLSINIGHKDDWVKFYLVDKKLKTVIQSDVNAASRVSKGSFTPCSSQNRT